MHIGISLSKKKQQRQKEERELQSGIRLLNDEVEMKDDKTILSYLLKGILIFFGVYGTIGAYLSCFSIAYHQVMVMVVLGIVSIYLSFLYYNKITQNIGYILLLILFGTTAWKFRAYVDSGFSAIMNITYDFIDQKYLLPAVQHMSERMADRYTSVTICVIFLGVFGAILLNMAISGYMSFWGTLWMTFPFLLVGLYFECTPDFVYIVMLVLCWGIIGILKKSRKYKLQKKGKIFLQKYKKGKQNYFYMLQGKAFVQTGVLLSIFLIFALICSSIFFPRTNFQTPKSWNVLKDNSDEMVRNFMVVGFSGFFNQYRNAGGVGGGQLGGVSSVRPNFETDLVVRFAPYKDDTVYLKAFIGVNYEGHNWTDRMMEQELFEEVFQNALDEDWANKESNILENDFLNNQKSETMKGKMQITNVGAAEEYVYYPYYSKVSKEAGAMRAFQDFVFGSYYETKTQQIEYYPFVNGIKATSEKEVELEAAYADYVRQAYLNVPVWNQEVIQPICDEIGTDITDEEKIEKVIAYLEEHCYYSMRPGLTPSRDDFVNYFLEKNNKGFCVHFASAATLIFRNMGIPARYIEGYAIPYSKVVDGMLVEEEKYEDWLEGEAPLGKTAVVDVDVTDAQAHAWVEIYQKGFGWIPVEVTPPNYETEDTTDFWSNFSNLFRTTGQSQENNAADFNLFGNQVTFISGKVAKRMLLCFGGCILFLFLLGSGRLVYKRIKRRRQFSLEDRNESIANYFEYVCMILKRSGIEKSAIYTKQEWIATIQEHFLQDIEASNKLAILIEKANYSQHTLTEEEYVFCVQCFSQIIKICRKQQNIVLKIILWLS